jgi:hypothetical protein
MIRLPRHIEHWSDERAIGNGVIVTLHWGWSFHPGEHLGVMGFDAVTEARWVSARKRVYPCRCELCLGDSTR